MQPAPAHSNDFSQLLKTNQRLSALVATLARNDIPLDLRAPTSITTVDRGDGKTLLIVDFTGNQIQAQAASPTSKNGNIMLTCGNLQPHPFTPDTEIIVIANSAQTWRGDVLMGWRWRT